MKLFSSSVIFLDASLCAVFFSGLSDLWFLCPLRFLFASGARSAFIICVYNLRVSSNVVVHKPMLKIFGSPRLLCPHLCVDFGHLWIFSLCLRNVMSSYKINVDVWCNFGPYLIRSWTPLTFSPCPSLAVVWVYSTRCFHSWEKLARPSLEL